MTPTIYIRVLTLSTLCVSWLVLAEPSRGELLLRWTFDETSSGDQNAANLGSAAGASGIFQGGATRTDNRRGIGRFR